MCLKLIFYLSHGTYHVKIIIALCVNNYFNMDVSSVYKYFYSNFRCLSLSAFPSFLHYKLLPVVCCLLSVDCRLLSFYKLSTINSFPSLFFALPLGRDLRCTSICSFVYLAVPLSISNNANLFQSSMAGINVSMACNHAL